MPRFRTAALILAPLLALSACGDIPDFRMPRALSPAPAPAPQPLPPIAAVPGAPTAGAAEAACQAAGRERGFDVQGIVGSSDVMGAGGVAVSRDVMLRVARGTQVFDLRCNYSYAEAQARVMAL